MVSYYILKKKIKLIINQKNKIYFHTQLSYVLHSIEISNKGNKNIYFNTMEKNTYSITALKERWCEVLNDDICDITLLNSFKNAKKFSPSVYQHYNQYKLLHRNTVNNQLLKKRT